METARFTFEVHNCRECPYTLSHSDRYWGVMRTDRCIVIKEQPAIPSRGILPECPCRLESVKPDDEYTKWLEECKTREELKQKEKSMETFWEEVREEGDKK